MKGKKKRSQVRVFILFVTFRRFNVGETWNNGVIINIRKSTQIVERDTVHRFIFRKYLVLSFIIILYNLRKISKIIEAEKFIFIHATQYRHNSSIQFSSLSRYIHANNFLVPRDSSVFPLPSIVRD